MKSVVNYLEKVALRTGNRFPIGTRMFVCGVLLAFGIMWGFFHLPPIDNNKSVTPRDPRDAIALILAQEPDPSVLDLNPKPTMSRPKLSQSAKPAQTPVAKTPVKPKAKPAPAKVAKKTVSKKRK